MPGSYQLSETAYNTSAPVDTPQVTSLEFNGSVSPFTFTCTSTGSPPTTVIWTKDNKDIVIDGTVFKLSRTVVNRTTATFKNVLTVDGEFVDMIGNYSCSVVNVFGQSESKTVRLKGTVHKYIENSFLVIR